MRVALRPTGKLFQTSLGLCGEFSSNAARDEALGHVHPSEEDRLMARHEVRLRDEIRGTDRISAQSADANGDRAGLFRIIDKVAQCSCPFSPMILRWILCLGLTVPSGTQGEQRRARLPAVRKKTFGGGGGGGGRVR